MKILKKVLVTLLAVLIVLAVGGYIYFDQKFTPDENYLTVENESGNIPLTWLGTSKNVLLLPIHFEGDTNTYYLQFDTGSPYTVFYAKSIKNIGQIAVNKDLAKTKFFIGKTKISSNKFKVYNFGNDNENNALQIIGTIGADILENRKTLINFKADYIGINLSQTPHEFQGKLFDFKFKKRRIIFNGILNGNDEKFLFDTGTSAYELLTNKEVWEKLRLPGSKTAIEKSPSWERVLTAYTANSKQKIQIANHDIPLNKVTYVEGFSDAQYSMMKFSGMTGMLGNSIFLNNSLFIDGEHNKVGIE
jgi:hypothetical protein